MLNVQNVIFANRRDNYPGEGDIDEHAISPSRENFFFLQWCRDMIHKVLPITRALRSHQIEKVTTVAN
jgi:hypothetical protein